MSLKESIYNIVVQDKDELLLYNSLNKKYVKFSKNINEVIKILKTPNEYIDNEICKFLYKEDYLVEVEKDENVICDLRNRDKINNKTLEICILPTEQCNFRCVYCYEKFELGNIK